MIMILNIMMVMMMMMMILRRRTTTITATTIAIMIKVTAPIKTTHCASQVSMRCKGGRSPPKARGDFAEGCWRPFTYDGQLPVGLSNRQTIVYLICQRFAAMSALGRASGHKRSHFATLYDTKGRAPVVSLVKLTELGDEEWPDTPYFIEHGKSDRCSSRSFSSLLSFVTSVILVVNMITAIVICVVVVVIVITIVSSIILYHTQG